MENSAFCPYCAEKFIIKHDSKFELGKQVTCEYCKEKFNIFEIYKNIYDEIAVGKKIVDIATDIIFEAIEIAENKTATVKIDQRGKRRSACRYRSVDSEPNGRVRPDGLDISHAPDRRHFLILQCAKFFKFRPRNFGRKFPHLKIGKLGQLLDERADKRIEWHETSGRAIVAGRRTAMQGRKEALNVRIL